MFYKSFSKCVLVHNNYNLLTDTKRRQSTVRNNRCSMKLTPSYKIMPYKHSLNQPSEPITRPKELFKSHINTFCTKQNFRV